LSTLFAIADSFLWCSIKNERRTLIGLEGVNVVEDYTNIDNDRPETLAEV
jgi:hypothetical protein